MGRFALAALTVAALATAGCGDRQPSLPSPVSASGKITLASGQPVKDVRIFFEPIDAMAAASSPVDQGGNFSLQTYENKKGACPGKYRVVLRVDQANLARSQAAIRAIPPRYTQDNSPLEIEVPSGGKTDFDLKLESR